MPTTYAQLEQDYYKCRRELTTERAISDKLEKALHGVNLCSQNSASSQYECGRVARAALSEVAAMRGEK